MNPPTSGAKRVHPNITPLVLTYDEAPNIGRCLSRLDWAKRVIVVDSYSTDRTLDICAAFENVTLVQRRFDTHAGQWNFALDQVSSEAPWVLALDADYILTSEYLAEMLRLDLNAAISGYRSRFRYAVWGQVIRSGIYPASITLFNRNRASYIQDGHTQRLRITGPIGRMRSRIIHDDHKPMDRWVASQLRYAALEADKIIWQSRTGHRLRVTDWLRDRTPAAPLLAGIYCLILRGGILEGRAGWFYACQRIAAEAIISQALIQARARAGGGGSIAASA
jgi:glycosyltransferase involved in cell wall biosynthesis